jgi:uncharacterized membrane protein
VFALAWNIATVIGAAYMLEQSGMFFEWKKNSVSVMKISLVVLLFVLLTGETRDFFVQKISTAYGTINSSVNITALENQQQLSLSGIWMLYSIALMAAGIMRHNRGIRIASISIFGFTIAKIFFFDLSFLETLYRIFSFIGLGIILLAVSYAYQKYKSIILETEKAEE